MRIILDNYTFERQQDKESGCVQTNYILTPVCCFEVKLMVDGGALVHAPVRNENVFVFNLLDARTQKLMQ